MGRALVSAFLNDLLDNFLATSPHTKTLQLYQQIISDLETIDRLVDDAEEKQFTHPRVKGWLDGLQHAVHRAEEFLGQITTKSSHGRQFYCGVFSTSMEMTLKIDKISAILTDVINRKKKLGLTEDVNVTRREFLQDLPPCSVVLDNYPKDCFYGREGEEKSMLELLSSTVDRIRVINIVGRAGEGKTAFANFIYCSHKVRESFELTAWVTVPSNARVEFIAKKILEAITEEFIPSNDSYLLRRRLEESFARKKFLLVLDDCTSMINDGLHNWNMLITPLKFAARGGAIILMARPGDDPLLMLPANHTLHLGLLSTVDCRSILLAHAFRQKDLNERPELVAVSEKIVNKLGNLPLAAKMIGSLLQDQLDLNVWLKILRSKLLDAGDVNPGLRIPSFLVLCYLDLPARLKRCFAYLSVFPKGYEFKQKEVVLLWMAQGFLQYSNSNSDGKSIEDIGDKYFGHLIMRSFLQPLDDGGVSFIMHDLVHDLATYVFGESRKHHLSYSNVKDILESILGRHGQSPMLRTILPMEVHLPLEWAPRQFRPRLELKKIIDLLNPQVLRVLSLSCYDITNLPASIGRLSHLCYLDLSYTALQTLPDSIGDLFNLQTLLLTHCLSLTSFPQRMCDLLNLRYLDVRQSGVQEMPLKMHKLTSLRTLTGFIVSKNGPRFGDLAGLSNLKTLTISKLQNVVDAMDASDVKLKEKKSLDDLMLQWGDGNDSNGNEMEVLENLEPHRDIKRLTIECYGGTRFPNWLGDASYRALQSLDLRHCDNCTSLPTLGLLPFLKDLFIEGFTKVSSIGREFYGVTTASHKPFQSLEILRFREMLKWKEWNILGGIEFPSLIELYIIRCPKLVGDLPKQLPSLDKLKIFGCFDLVASLPRVSNTCQVFVGESNAILTRNKVKIRSQPSSQRVRISEEVQELTPQSYYGFSSTKYATASSSTERAWMETEFAGNKLPPGTVSLDTRRIPKLKELSSGVLSPQVEADIPNTKQQTDPQSSLAKADMPIAKQAAVLPLTKTPETTAHVKEENLSREDLDDQRSSFEILKVSTVSQLKKLSPMLHSLKIEGCESLEALPDGLLNGIPTLQELYLISCSSLRSFPYPASLTTLYVRNCSRLEFLPSRQKLAFLQHLFIGSSCDSLTTLALNLFPELKILCIWDCPNLLAFSVAGEHGGDLASLESLEIRDCPRLMSFPDEGLPTPNLASIFLSNCKNLDKLPNVMNSLTSLKSLFLHRCPQLECFPYGGLPSSLTILSIAFCDKLTPQKGWGLHNLESLDHFELEGGCIGMESFPLDKLLPSNINYLRISTLQSLQKLDYKGFQHLNALETLEINCCDMLRSLPEQGLPSSLNVLCVQECPLLTPRLKPKTGKDWHKVARIPRIQIDDQVLS